MMKYLRWIILLLMLSLSLTACLSPVKTPPVQTYTLNSIAATRCSGSSYSKTTLMVSTPVANAGYQTSAMLYSLCPYEIDAFALHRWTAPPAQMLKFLIVQSIRNTGRFCAVAVAPTVATTDYRLDTHLIKLQQEFFTEPSQVRMVIQAILVNNKTNKIVFDRRIEAVVKAPCDTPCGGVFAANKATAEVLHKLAQAVASFDLMPGCGKN
jgi:cholesterol transport system auxiliary component